MKKVLLKILKNSQENICVRISESLKLLLYHIIANLQTPYLEFMTFQGVSLEFEQF